MIGPQQLADLRAKAEAATPGPWVRHHQRHGVSVHRADGGFDWVGAGDSEATADFITAANPATVIAMIDEIERLRERVAVLERVWEAAEPCVDALRDIAGDGHGEYLDQWAAAIEALYAAKETTDG